MFAVLDPSALRSVAAFGSKTARAQARRLLDASEVLRDELYARVDPVIDRATDRFPEPVRVAVSLSRMATRGIERQARSFMVDFVGPHAASNRGADRPTNAPSPSPMASAANSTAAAATSAMSATSKPVANSTKPTSGKPGSSKTTSNKLGANKTASSKTTSNKLGANKTTSSKTKAGKAAPARRPTTGRSTGR